MTELFDAPERATTLPPVAGRAERFAAHVLDSIFTTVLFIAALLGMSLDVAVLDVVFGVLAGAVWLFYLPLSMQLMQGSTPGKRMMGGLWVARADGQPVGFALGVWRDVVLKTVLGFLIVVDGLFVLARTDRKALHDLGARTTVRSQRP